MNTIFANDTAANTTIANDAGFSFAPKQWPLNLEQMRCLFEKLAEDDDYRALFMADLGAALAQLPGAPAVPAGLVAGGCFRPNNLASKEALRAVRDRVVTIALAGNPMIPKMLEV
ncbi:NHLP-related RiPP peptide [Chiayiivirga flava]|uniref:Putative modified peptide n=1 Tax=Chiayiivirga flava TaxID=659595 RepID=A0A7W8D6Y1_9GAMM|nr:NHLP-related RiPP peptide [Chiayiivirga flava]MBB5207827.1 putative modified peptide [Chiayiivirga flava]